MNLEELDKPKIIELIKIQQAKRKSVVTPANILKNLGYPIFDHHFILQNKKVWSNLKQILRELEKEGFITERKSKQTFLGAKEVGYDYIP